MWVAGVSGHQNWKANRALCGLEDQPHWFWGAASETPLRICCRKHARLGIRGRFFPSQKLVQKKQTQPYPSGAAAYHCAVLPLTWHLHSSITSSWLLWLQKSRGRRSHADLEVTLRSTCIAASSKQSLSMYVCFQVAMCPAHGEYPEETTHLRAKRAGTHTREKRQEQ